MRFRNWLIAGIAVVSGWIGARAASGEPLVLNRSVRVYGAGGIVELTGAGQSVRFQPNIKYNNDWVPLGAPSREPQFQNPGNYNELILEYEVPARRTFRLSVKTFADRDGAVIDGRLINDSGSSVVEYYFWSWRMDATGYIVADGDGFARHAFDPVRDDTLDRRPFVYLSFEHGSGGLAVAVDGVIGCQHDADGGGFFYERAIEHDQELPPGGGYRNALAVGLVADAARAADFAVATASWVSPDSAPAAAVDYGRPAPEWLSRCRTMAGYYRPWSVETGRYWSDEVLDTRLKDFPVIIGSQPNPEILERVHRRGKKLLFYVIYTCLLDTKEQVASGGRVYEEWRESPLCEERDLADHPDWSCIDAEGKRFHDLWGTMNHHMGLFYTCLHQKGVQDAALRQVAKLMELGYDGIFIDLAGPTVECHGDKFGVHAHPEPQKTNTDKYYELLDRIYALVKSYGDDRVVILNGPIASNWPRADALMWEAAVYAGGDGKLNQTPSELILLGKRYREARRNGKMLLPLVVLPKKNAFECALFSYAYAMIFDLAWTDYTELWDYDRKGAETLYGLRPGKPENDGHEVQSGVWRRDFSAGTFFWSVANVPVTLVLPPGTTGDGMIGPAVVTRDPERGPLVTLPPLSGVFVRREAAD